MPSTEWNQMINELGRKYGSLEEHPFLDEKIKRLLVERIPAYVTGNIPGTMPAAFKKLYLEELPKMEYRAGYAESHPQEALDLAASVLGLGTPFGPSGPDTLGLAKGFRPVKTRKLPELASTEEALAFGQAAGSREIDLLKQGFLESRAKIKELRAQKRIDEALAESFRSQFFREALEATGRKVNQKATRMEDIFSE